MPFISVTTNVNVSVQAVEDLMGSLTDLVVAKLNKPKEYVQVAVNTNQPMQFAGTVEPTAFVELRALGLGEEAANVMAPELTSLVHGALSISPDRVFINLLDVPRARWGWNGATFG